MTLLVILAAFFGSFLFVATIVMLVAALSALWPIVVATLLLLSIKSLTHLVALRHSNCYNG